MPSSFPTEPWQEIGVDLAFQDQTRCNYLVVVDYFSRWIECIYLNSTTSTSVVGRLKVLFARYGILYELVSDNGTQFTSLKVHHFAVECSFVHITSSPYNPRSNRAAERAVNMQGDVDLRRPVVSTA